MRDDFAIPNMGEAPQNYDKAHINRVVRNVEMTFRTAKSKGPATFTELTADSFNINDIAVTGKVRLANTGDVTLAGDAHAFQIGPSTGQNVAFDNNEIMSRNNGGVASLVLNADGGDVTVGEANTNGGIRNDGVTISKTVANRGMVLAGGNNAANGANIELYGGSHATDANRAFYDAVLHTFRVQSGVPSLFDVDATQFRTFVKARLPDTGDVSLSSTGHAFQIGADNAANIRMDGNEIMSVNNGTVNELHLQADGGDVTLHQNATGSGDFNTLILRGGRINFPTAQNASTNANTLDDYEEGTWTPVVSFGFGSVGMTYSIQGGYYVKVGQMVVVQLRTIFTAKGSSTGNARISGLPFACTTATGQAYTPVTWGYYSGFTALPTPTGYIEHGNAYINLMFHGATAVGAISDASFTNTSDMIITAVYRASA